MQGLLHVGGQKWRRRSEGGDFLGHKACFWADQSRVGRYQACVASALLLADELKGKGRNTHCQARQEPGSQGQIWGSEGNWEDACQMVSSFSCHFHAWPWNQVGWEHRVDSSSKICHSRFLPCKSIWGASGSVLGGESLEMHLLWWVQEDSWGVGHGSPQELPQNR